MQPDTRIDVVTWERRGDEASVTPQIGEPSSYPDAEPIVPSAANAPAVPAPTSHPMSRGYTLTIRLLDVVASLVVLVLAAPLVATIALLVRFDSSGPAIFRHQRVGLNRRLGATRRHGANNWQSEERRSAGQRRTSPASGKPFTLYKFRTMYSDARSRFPELYSYTYSEEELAALPIKILVSSKLDPESIEGAVESAEVDPRITRVGRWLRRTSLDELPNLWNVLKGDLHLVGPRPDIEENVRYYQPAHMQKLDVKPGITGPAQVEGRGRLTFHATNELDADYVEQRSLALDLRILLKTVLVSLKGEGAY